jgi:methylmalonyl-CoA/ethylmalonyl-CoA epimerase
MELPLDHVAIAVPSITQSQPVFELLTGGTASGRERIPAQGVEVVFIGTGSGSLELLEPTDPASAVARFLEKRGPGLHHVAYRVPDLDATLARLDASGFELIDHAPRAGARGHRVAFLHPRSCGGVLVELVEGSGSSIR